jgi:hypothetical protein
MSCVNNSGNNSVNNSVNKTELILNTNKAITLINFYKIFKDLIVDLDNSFKDKIGVIVQNNKDYQNIINYCLPDYKDNMNADEYVNSLDLTSLSIEFMESVNNVYEYCKRTFAVRSIDILYQNEDIFLNKEKVKVNDENPQSINTIFLPDIEFSELYYDDTSDKTKQTLWKYLQLILFNIITTIDDVSFFGDSLELLKIIDGDKFSSKIQNTIEDISKLFSFKENADTKNEANTEENEKPDFAKMFDMSSNPFSMFNDMLNDLSGNLHNSTENEEPPNNNDYAIPDKEELFSHINKLINGKIGSLAKEIAEETTKDMNLDSENITDANDVLKGFMKNPTKLLGLISKISNKINSKMKDGSLKESELLEEATNIFKNMKTMPGMENFNEIFKSMNLDQFMPKGSKINPTAFQNMMEQNVKMSKMKERMKKKAETKGETPDKSNTSYRENYDSNKSKAPYSSDNIKLDDLTSNLSSLMEEMKNNTSFIDDIIKKQGQQGQRDANINAIYSDDNSKRKSNNKRKVNKKNK